MSLELDSYQKAIVEFDHKLDTVLLIPSAAGAGKSTSILAKIADIIRAAKDKKKQASKILATTFSNKAAKDLIFKFKETYPDLPIPNISTLHSFGIRVIKEDDNSPIIMNPWNATLLIRSCIDELEIYEPDVKKSVTTKLAETIKKIVENLKAITEFDLEAIQNNVFEVDNYIDPDTDSEIAEIIKDNFNDIIVMYEDKKRKDSLYDYTDLIYKSNIILKENETVLNSIRDSLDYVFIDEAQDCDKAQFDLFFKISEHKRLTLVYDICQTLYKFRWSSPELIHAAILKNYFKEIVELPLLYNYRSTKNIVDVGNTLRKIADDDYQSISTKDYVKGSVSLKVVANNLQEGNIIVKAIDGYVKEGFSLRDITIISRSNWYLRTIVEPALVRNKIPYTFASKTSGKKLNEKNINRLLFSMISFILNPSNYLSVYEMIQYIKGIGPAFIEKVENIYTKQGIVNLSACGAFTSKSDLEKCKEIELLLIDLREINDNLHSIEASNFVNMLQDTIFKYMTLPSSFDELQQIEAAIANWINFYKDSGRVDNRDILETILLDINNFDITDKKDVVVLSTIHQTKGLSIPVTITAGFTTAMEMPDLYNDEQYMIYVQMSRAIHKLCIVLSTQYITKANKTIDPYINKYLNQMLSMIKGN